MTLPWLDPDRVGFPPTSNILEDPNGLLAAGGALTPEWLLFAYSQGIFPWYNEGDPILWWSPAPRMVIYPKQLHISRSLRKALKKMDYTVTINHDFNGVINACSEPRAAQTPDDAGDTWISQDMKQAYNRLHRLGFAHSVEVWQPSSLEERSSGNTSENTLVGGLYGIALGQVFFGESMFSRVANASKIAISHLASYLDTLDYQLIDCQIHNPHLESLGGVEITREAFEQTLQKYAQGPLSTENTQHWQAKTLINPFI